MLDTIFLIAAVIGGTVMVCQFILTLLGMGDDLSDGDLHVHGDVADAGDYHGDAGDGAGDLPDASGEHHTTLAAADGETPHHDTSWLFGVISLRTLVAAAAFFGVAGMAASSAGFSEPKSMAIGLLAGLAAMYGMYWLMQSISRLTSSGNERIGNAVGCRGSVYIPIPPQGQGTGKVQLSMQNRIVEFQAVTNETDRLRTGETVEVVAVAGSDLVRVRRVAQPIEA